MKLKIGTKFKKKRTPTLWKKYQIVGKTEKGSWRVKDLSDGSIYIEPFLDGNYCHPI